MQKWSEGTTEPSQLRSILVNWEPYICSCCKTPFTRQATASRQLGTLDNSVTLNALISGFSLPKKITGKSLADSSLLYKLSDFIVLILELSFLCFMRRKVSQEGFLLKVLLYPPTNLIIGVWMFQGLKSKKGQNWSFGIFLNINLKLHEQFCLRP